MGDSAPLRNFDPTWEQKYASGHSQRAPWDIAVSFVFRYAPEDRQRRQVKILEVGCGTGSNLWFAAREGFSVSGIDASASAIAEARLRLAKDGLEGQLEVGDFTVLPFDADSFDLVIDRGALTCAGTQSQLKAIGEIHRVLRLGGSFLYTPFADTHYSRQTGRPGPDDVILDISGGTLQNVGQIRFVGRSELPLFVPPVSWEAEVVEYQAFEDIANPERGLHSSWRIIVRKR
jgi:SAM-dependent methyltransferase